MLLTSGFPEKTINKRGTIVEFPKCLCLRAKTILLLIDHYLMCKNDFVLNNKMNTCLHCQTRQLTVLKIWLITSNVKCGGS